MEIARGIASRGEKKAARRVDGPAIARPQEARVRLLHDIVNLYRCDHAVQIAAERRFVRQDFIRKPAGVIGPG